VTGESGTGKELVARALHRYGPRRNGPFVTVDCASLPAGLLESELFGHERGAFTGAERARPGKFEEADGGTLFLDEIGNLPPEVQAKLLRALQSKTTTRLGSNAPVSWNARIVSATNADLKTLAAEGKFREDLRYRLAGAEIRLPPLRDRLEDVPRLAEHFLARHATADRLLRLSAEAERVLRDYRWPGNVRELEHALARAAALARSAVIGLEDLPAEVRGLAPLAATGLGVEGGRSGLVTLEEAKRRYARHALTLCGGNKSEAARLLDIDRSTLAALLKEGP
ncbi:MAG: sigma-54 dependent transcriptional regulator, partial [bacterium]